MLDTVSVEIAELQLLVTIPSIYSERWDHWRTALINFSKHNIQR